MAKPVALVAFDSFKGSASAAELVDAAALGLAATWAVRRHPLSDGGDGFANVLAAACPVVDELEVDTTDALGRPIRALVPVLNAEGERVAIVEAARACGLAQVGGPGGNDPLRASTRGVGELILAAREANVARAVVGCGGSATSDGGAGALEVLADAHLGGLRIDVAVDVATRFTEAAEVFAPQKGANPRAVAALGERLHRLAIDYAEAYATLVDRIPGSGAAGGLAGGLAALGARVTSGFEVVAELTGLDRDLDGAALLVTGEGRLDRTSLEGKVVVALARRAPAEARIVVLAGSVEGGMAEALAAELGRAIEVVDLGATYGLEACMANPAEVVERAARAIAEVTER